MQNRLRRLSKLGLPRQVLLAWKRYYGAFKFQASRMKCNKRDPSASASGSQRRLQFVCVCTAEEDNQSINCDFCQEGYSCSRCNTREDSPEVHALDPQVQRDAHLLESVRRIGADRRRILHLHHAVNRSAAIVVRGFSRCVFPFLWMSAEQRCKCVTMTLLFSSHTGHE